MVTSPPLSGLLIVQVQLMVKEAEVAAQSRAMILMFVVLCAYVDAVMNRNVPHGSEDTDLFSRLSLSHHATLSRYAVKSPTNPNAV
jgi:hypothetical protein